MSAPGDPVGFVGLGNMGATLAANLLGRGLDVVCHDVAGPDRAPDGARFVPSVADVAAQVDTVVLCLPDGRASASVARELVDADPRRVTHVLDTSTVGVGPAAEIAELLAAAGIAHVDAAVSGGVDGARARTLSVMYSGPDDACEQVAPVLAALSDRRTRVGDGPGLAQAVKLANNFLSATALAATSEAIAFGTSVGVDMATMLDVLNASSGQSTATSDKFPRHVLTGRYASGFTSSLMDKDLRLYLEAVEEQGGPAALGRATGAIWEAFAATEPGVDFTRIFPFVEGGSRGSGPSVPENGNGLLIQRDE